ncbi:hypothetical protein FOE78_12190 [Microlunatus elymi]|uniref:DUF5615 domain-containing protein n=1 Tax=Microlunatus elymi TaxID=2596828 RepID=A0A516PZF6_9ACTN|nr:DUF5615 family PIN-like protein [Microlunatus elymi]QDP96565.1 hypothetical protein FOE78_12190 [Microlunatus elymi]
MTARFMLDEHLPPVIAEQLAARSIDAVAVSSRPDLRTLPDPEILQAAAAEKRILVTRNIGDFVQLDTEWAAAGRGHSGILCIANRRFPENRGLIGALTAALTEWSESGPDIAGTHWFL